VRKKGDVKVYPSYITLYSVLVFEVYCCCCWCYCFVSVFKATLLKRNKCVSI